MSTLAAGPPRFELASDQTLLVRFSDAITPEANRQVRKLLRLLQSEPLAGVRNLHPAYASLLVKFDPLAVDCAQLEQALRRRIDRLQDFHLPEPRRIEIPVCYGGEFGPDLEDVAASGGVSASRAIEMHASANYIVYFLGFAPGFPYLGGLPQTLATPRLATPRRSVPPGSVGIASNQTAVYPFATPGGWRLIGRTPLRMFQPDREQMNLLLIGDEVRFKPISAAEFAAQSQAVTPGMRTEA